MSTTPHTEKNFAFIDSQNVNLAIKDLGWNLDFGRFRQYLKDKYKISKAFLFIGYVPQHQGLYTYLQQVGYIVVFKPTLTLPNGKVKGNVDAELVLHAMLEYQNYDRALIITGDGDFYCLVEHLIKNNKLLKLMVPNQKDFSRLYSKITQHIVSMNTLKDKVGKK